MEYLKCCINIANNQRNIQQLDEAQKLKRYQLQMDLINQSVRGEQKPFRKLEEWEEMEAQFRELRSRYKFFRS